MRKSNFTIIVPSENSKNELCLYHTLSDHLIHLSQSDDSKLEDLLNRIRGKSLNSLSENDLGLCETLAQLGFIVPDDADEYELFEKWYRAVLKTSYRSYAATILTTMSCNLRCPYCYEQNLLSSSKFMSSKMATHVSSWIQRQIVERGVEKLSVIFFGGEPLLNCNVIEQISSVLSEVCRSIGIGWKAGVITNGTLLTKSVAELLMHSGVSWAKVTLDGDKEGHDRLRRYADGHGSFDRIFENLEQASEYLRLMIGGNIDESNIDTVPSLLDRLASASWKKAIMSVQFKPIRWSEPDVCVNSKTACQLSAFTPEQLIWMIRLRQEVQKRGLPVISDPNLGPCDFYRPNVISIGIDGSLYPCGAFVGLPDFVMGNVQNNELTDFGREVEGFRAWDGKCRDCSYLPLCAGGCRAAAYFGNKGLNAVVCDREFYRQMLPRYIVECDDSQKRNGELASMFG